MSDTLRVAGGAVLHPDFTVSDGDVLVDRDAGEIIAVGDTPAGDETVDAAGCLVMPGLVNAHCHVAMTLLRGYADDKQLDAWLQEDIWPAEAELADGDIRAGARLGLVEMIRAGTTAFADMYFEVPEVVDAITEAGLRARVGHGVVTVGKDDADAVADNEEALSVAREFNDAADGRITSAYMPHSLTTVGEEYLREFVAAAREADVPVHFHANETEQEVEPIVDEHGSRPLEYAADVGLLAEDDFLAHGVHTTAGEIELLAESGASVVHCPASNMKLASGMAPVQAMREAGVTVALGTDGAASNNDLDVFDELRDAAMLGKLQTGAADAVPARAAVEMATAGGAAALGFDSGRIEVGANADLAVVDFDAPHLTPVHDHVSHLAYAATGQDVRHTICDGEVLMRDREVLPFDEAAVREQAAQRASELAARAGE
ncbi:MULTISPECIES: amidohydrolase [Halobacterium]|uniref:5-methylthioadenosine/S-adenosylhomocysteine deaminase n=4 Tax=Halobacterium salinarum TaxID=2242 RepID=MTAD_HALSA|nr:MULTISPECIES: amidohydrolase [Halobacterium]Q9HN51.1 RecName: Full=5-methylthioadenosine/S-adenosylhomocysteine deaminase; Short=MTA/SAH deaminase [Halobacterium salinarum NRC-1]AAG20370.1 N-ethylammeline chlorohydrolase [Halobacterium salinarum NRC-1]MBB6089705.1 5-methylthioadenosine/S-adenosylhomocysteine deaminase [Halobacterium salinarum]MDL0119886.1 amidohydrolase [Halobacterium salinarum]MDL0128777.1 amidohydrolase [Halobacterium salinarum]MDL0130036.1 amidohydrolase [Halobacterium 